MARELAKQILVLISLCVLRTVIAKDPKKDHHVSQNTTLQNYKDLHAHLFTNYSASIRPVFDQSNTLTVSCSLAIRSILDYDVVTGVFSFSGEINSEWVDESLTWDMAEFGGIKAVRIPAKYLWMPDIGIDNAAENGVLLNTGTVGMNLNVKDDGKVHASYGGVIRTMCTANTYFYPFDTHNCEITLIVFGYDSTEIRLTSLKHSQINEAFMRHGEWDVSFGSLVKDHGIDPKVSISVVLSRRSVYLFLTTCLPLLLQILLHDMVFILPADCGERMSFSITMFLSYAVFMTIVSEKMPPTNPISLMNIFLTFLLLDGALILICNIISLNVYHRHALKEIPRYLKNLTSLMLRKHRVFKHVVVPHSPSLKGKLQRLKLSLEKKAQIGEGELPEGTVGRVLTYPLPCDVQWTMVAAALDRIFFVFYILQTLVFVGICVHLYSF